MTAGTEPFFAPLALLCCAWSERWVPDAFAVVGAVVGLVSVAALSLGVPVPKIAASFGNGFWSLIPFTMQMTFIVIGGFVVADSPPVARLTTRLAAIPRR